MRQRKEHAITAVAGDAQPKRLVALAVETEVDGKPGTAHEQREALRSWAGCGWERSEAGAYREWACAGGTAARLWRAFLYGAKRGGTTWMIATRAVRVASLLGLWELIDAGQLQWDGADGGLGNGALPGGSVRPVRQGEGSGMPDRRRDAVGRVPDVRRAAPAGRDTSAPGGGGGGGAGASVVVSDPPTILRMRVPGRPGRLWLLDARNWGVEPPGPFGSATDEARWLSGVMRRMVDELARRGWGGLKATAGSQALSTWRRAYMTHKVIAHGDDEVLGLEEASYHGGRCECGRLGRVDGPLFWIDRRSAYGHACATTEVPVAVEGRRDGEWHAIVADSQLAGRCLAECRIEGDEPAYPGAAKDGVRYQSGRRTCTLAGPEFRDAVERGYVVGIGRCVEYRTAAALRAYAQSLWGARREYDERGEPALSAWAKRLIVSLPGKLGQRVADWTPAPRVPPLEMWASWWGLDQERRLYRLRSLSGVVSKQERSGWTYDSVPAAASWILSAARVELLRAIRVAGWDECLYWDTDALLLTGAGWDRVRESAGLAGVGLGQWRLVQVVQVAVIHGVKHYDFDGLTTCAGQPKADTEPTRLPDHYWYRDTFGTALNRLRAPRAARRLRKYVRASPYTLGRVGDGGRVYPHVGTDW